MKKSKKTIISAACALLALLTTACSNDDVVDGNKDGKRSADVAGFATFNYSTHLPHDNQRADNHKNGSQGQR